LSMHQEYKEFAVRFKAVMEKGAFDALIRQAAQKDKSQFIDTLTVMAWSFFQTEIRNNMRDLDEKLVELRVGMQRITRWQDWLQKTMGEDNFNEMRRQFEAELHTKPRRDAEAHAKAAKKKK